MESQTPHAIAARYQRSFPVRAGYLPEDPSHLHDWNDMFVGAVPSGKPDTYTPRHRTVESFAELLDHDPIIRMLVHEMIEQEQLLYPDKPRNHVQDVNHLLELLDNVVKTAPTFGRKANPATNTKAEPAVAFPMSALLGFMMMTTAGEAVFRHPKFNEALRAILSEWCAFLTSPASKTVLTRKEGGWLSPIAYHRLKLADYKITEADDGGFRCWDEFFRRELKDVTSQRPLPDPDDDALIVSANDGPVRYIARNVKAKATFWVKGEYYSLRDMLATDERCDTFAGGDVIQSFLAGSDYHRFTSPIAGEILEIVPIPGLLFSNAESAGYDPEGVDSLVYDATVNTRTLVVIKGNEAVGTVCVIPIGITEVSSLTINVKCGDHVKKGDELGWFSFGGSTLCMVFQPGKIGEFVVDDKTRLSAREHIATAIPIRTTKS
jgi:phosphatidylserine decarboxylase